MGAEFRAAGRSGFWQDRHNAGYRLCAEKQTHKGSADRRRACPREAWGMETLVWAARFDKIWGNTMGHGHFLRSCTDPLQVTLLLYLGYRASTLL